MSPFQVSPAESDCRERFVNPMFKNMPNCDPNRILDSPLPLLLRRVTLW